MTERSALNPKASNLPDVYFANELVITVSHATLKSPTPPDAELMALQPIIEYLKVFLKKGHISTEDIKTASQGQEKTTEGRDPDQLEQASEIKVEPSSKQIGKILKAVLEKSSVSIDSKGRTFKIVKIPFPEAEPLVKAIQDVNRLLKVTRPNNPESRENSDGPATIHLLSPNWYAGGVSESVPSGGPAERPEPAEPRKAYKGDPISDKLDKGEDISGYIKVKLHPEDKFENATHPEDVDIYILDAFPNKKSVEEKLKGLPQKHALRSLWLSDKLKWYDRNNPGHHLPKIDVPDQELPSGAYPYDMRDHGLFIAGIIHSIAPSAKLHLIPVLNDFGIGTVVSFAQGLEVFHEVQQSRQNRHYVVNLSLDYGLIVPNPQDERTVYTELRKWLGNQSDSLATDKEVTEFVEETYDGPKSLVRILDPNLGYFVAAAGNDAKPRQEPRPDARYPAKHESVISVGALKKQKDANGKPVVADYSDLVYAQGEEKEQKGVWTLGGFYIDAKDEWGGILGVSSIERSGYVWWAGTSFSCAIVSGALAQLWAKGSRDARKDLFDIIKNNPVTDPKGLAVGPALYATQP